MPLPPLPLLPLPLPLPLPLLPLGCVLWRRWCVLWSRLSKPALCGRESRVHGLFASLEAALGFLGGALVFSSFPDSDVGRK